MTHAEPPQTGRHDDYESEDLGAGEDILYSSCPFDIVAINDGQQTCECDRKMKLSYVIIVFVTFVRCNHMCENNLMKACTMSFRAI